MKEAHYKKVYSQAKSLLHSTDREISKLSNLCALLKEEFSFWWVGFYLVDEAKRELYLGPFQGPLACTTIAFGKGVCGTCWAQEKAIIVDDVHSFDGHIACSEESNSEIVIPIFKSQKIYAVLDIDSKEFKKFDNIDLMYLKKICELI